jgi:hypothetical protein
MASVQAMSIDVLTDGFISLQVRAPQRESCTAAEVNHNLEPAAKAA